MSLRVFLAGEGPTDIGDLSKHSTYRNGREGFLQPVVRKLLGQDVAFVGAKLTTLAKTPFSEPREALARQARQACALAAFEEATVVVFVHDVDRAQGEKRSPREISRRIEELTKTIEKGFSAAATDCPDVLGVVATPCRMVEAWALGDANAVSSCSGDASALPSKSPETWWGDEEDPSSNHPKCVFNRVFTNRPKNLFEELGAAASPDTLSTSCPLSFGPFRTRMKKVRRA